MFWDRKLGRGISGVRKIWRLLRREGIAVARCTVERLMRQEGLRGIRRGKQFVTTERDDAANRPPDRVQRCFRAYRPNELWVVDFTYVPTWSGMAFTAFVTDVFSRRIVGWRTMNRIPTDLPSTRSRWRSGPATAPAKTSRASSNIPTQDPKADSTGRRNTLIVEVFSSGDEVLVDEDERGS